MVFAVVKVRPESDPLIALVALLESTTVPAPLKVTLLAMESVLPLRVMLPVFAVLPVRVVVVPEFNA